MTLLGGDFGTAAAYFVGDLFMEQPGLGMDLLP
jgi:hypothetical protein